MPGRRHFLLGSAAAVTLSLAGGAMARTAAATVTKRGFLRRPGCRLYYEVTGSGPAIVFAHGIDGNHLTWWQQVPHFSGRFTCVTFAHRGYPPGSEIPDGPDPRDFAGDLAALIDHLQLSDTRLVAHSMGGLTCLEYLLRHAHKVRALVLASTCGTLQKISISVPDPQRLTEWQRKAETARANLLRRGIFPSAGERMAREQPALHYLYQTIVNASVSPTFEREDLDRRNSAISSRLPEALRGFSTPTLFISGEEDLVYPPFLSAALAPVMVNARAEMVRESGHAVHFERAAIFNGLVDRFFAGAG